MKAHHKRAKGGNVEDKLDREEEGEGKITSYSAEDNVEKEAKERKRGGRAMKKRADGGKVDGEKPKHRMDRVCRKDGGRVGSDTSPLSSAHSVSAVSEHKTDD
jgi:hypothetical protein